MAFQFDWWVVKNQPACGPDVNVCVCVLGEGCEGAGVERGPGDVKTTLGSAASTMEQSSLFPSPSLFYLPSDTEFVLERTWEEFSLRHLAIIPPPFLPFFACVRASELWASGHPLAVAHALVCFLLSNHSFPSLHRQSKHCISYPSWSVLEKACVAKDLDMENKL